MLDYGYRSKCCLAPIRMGYKITKISKTRVKIWICTKCAKRDVDIISKDDLKGQENKSIPFAEYIERDE